MNTRFRDRRHAGTLLAEKLSEYAGRDQTLVLALPRGGVPVAFEVAAQLHLPLDVFVVRKLGVPGHEELAMGAVAQGGIRVMNEDVFALLDIPQKDVEATARRELVEIERREAVYRNSRPPLSVQGKTILLVDDGVATGSTMLAAIEALRQQHAAKIVAAVPTIASSSLAVIAKQATEVVAVMAPHHFVAVGQWYDDFSQTSDEEVRELLERERDQRAA